MSNTDQDTDFPSLSHLQQLRRLRRLALAALAHYGLAEARLTLVQYEDNAVYKVVTSGGEQFVLRIGAANEYDAAALRSELAWLAALGQDTDLLVPTPVPEPGGDLLMTVTVPGVPEPRRCVLLHWLPGRPLRDDVTAATAAAIGACAARLHQHAAQFVLPLGFVRPSWDWEGLFGTAAEVAPERFAARLSARASSILAETGSRVCRELAALGCGAGDWGLIHADLHRGNLLLHRGHVAAIDFNDCGWGYYLFDVATALSSLRRVIPDARTYAARRAALLDGYARIRPQPARADAWLRACHVLRELQIVGFVVGSDNAAVQGWGPGRVAEIVEGLGRYLQV